MKPSTTTIVTMRMRELAVTSLRCALAVAMLLLVAPAVRGQATESSLRKQLEGLRAVPDAQRPAATTQIARTEATSR